MNDISARRQRLRTRIAQKRPLVIPGAGDGLGARLIEKAGFEAAYMSGFCVEGSYGFPDVGYLGMSEMAGRAAIMAQATTLPLICDADTGYGNVVNVTRTVREFERAGVAAIQLEDQQLPKKCGSMVGKRIVPIAEMTGKIRAAVDARHDSNLLVIGRTDAAAIEGMDRAIERMHAYAEAGADLLMVLGPYTPRDVARLGRETPLPIVYLNSESLTMPMIPANELHDLGIDIVVFPLALLLSATRAMERTLEKIRLDGTTLDIIDDAMVSWSGFNDLMGLGEVKQLEERYAEKVEA
jgi:2-methylisocitrate lyase-like PEP mutase family enzyme